MVTTFVRILRYGFQSFWRNGWLSAATIMVMILALLVFLGLLVFGVVTEKAIATLQDKIDISVYFKPELKEDEIFKIEKSVESLSEVRSVEYISKEKALDIFKTRHDADATISKALEELNENPLVASLNIKAKDPRDYGKIAEYLENDKLKNSIDKVTYGQNQLAITRLIKIADTASAAGLAMTLILAFIATVVTFNTVRLAIYSSREEIGVMRLVGASNTYIRGPYIVEGVIYGVISAILALVIMAPMMYVTAPYIMALIPEMDLVAYFYTHLISLASYSMLAGIVLGTFSSYIAIRRYLRI
jgi:cell division transport system permease protein